MIPLLILLAVGLGCSTIRELANKGSGPGSSNSNTAASNSGSSTTSSTTNGETDAKDVIIAASRKFIALPYFSAKMEGTGINELNMQVEYVAPDRFHIHYLAGGGTGMETIIIGKQTYVKLGGGWRKMPMNLGESIPSLRDYFTEEGLKSISDVKLEGEDTVNGKPALVYSYSNVTPVEKDPLTSKIWIGKDSGMPMKISVDYSHGKLKEMNVVYDTETPVSIEPPVN